MYALHHVQLAMAEGQEDRAREFFVDVLGMDELPKPPELARRGGVWFRCGDPEIHLGVEAGFAPAKKAHPGILTDDLDDVAQRLRGAGHELRYDDTFPGFRRFYVEDPHGYRLEFLQRQPREEARRVA